MTSRHPKRVRSFHVNSTEVSKGSPMGCSSWILADTPSLHTPSPLTSLSSLPPTLLNVSTRLPPPAQKTAQHHLGLLPQHPPPCFSKPAQFSKHTQPLDGFLSVLQYMCLTSTSICPLGRPANLLHREDPRAVTCPLNHLFSLPPSCLLPSLSFSLFLFLPLFSAQEASCFPRIRV